MMLEQFLPEPLIGILRQVMGLPNNQQYVYDDYQRIYWAVRYQLGLTREQVISLLTERELPLHFRYRQFTVPKKDGSRREIVEPGAELKRVQRAIIKYRLAYHWPHPTAMGFRRGKSIADHAWAHAGAGIIITADIKDFFPSTRYDRVLNWWQENTYYPMEARLMARLTTHLGSLPQGAPTSPPLSNLVNHPMDARLESRTLAAGGTYTRYADDMVFSWPDGLRPPADFEQNIRSTLREFGYELHPRKGWQVWYRRDEPQVTGLILTRGGGVDVPDSMKRLMKELKRHKDNGSLQKLSGYEGFVQMVKR